MDLTLLETQFQTWKGCPLSEKANPVFGEGHFSASVMFIGEAPGEQEDKLGRPFVGAAGKFLDELLNSIGLKREEVYISNVVKFRPPGNREPTPEEKEQCMPWLKMEIAIVRPRVICPLGRHALVHFFPTLSMTTVHGKPMTLTDAVTIFPIYHPAAALHNPSLRTALAEDFRRLRQFLDGTLAAVAIAKPLAP